MKTSDRVSRMKASTTLAVTARAKELRAEGKDVISFAAGEPDFVTPAPIVAAAKRALDEGLTHYAPVPGDPKTRALLAEKLARVNSIPGVTPDHERPPGYDARRRADRARRPGSARVPRRRARTPAGSG